MFARITRWFAKRALAHAHAVDAEKRAALRARPFPPEWYPFVAEIPQTYGLTRIQRDKLHGDILVFLGEKELVGADGFVVDDRARVIVATCASLLVIGRDIAAFDHVRQIILRPEVGKSVGGFYQQMQSTLNDEVVDTWAVVELGWTAVAAGLVRPEGQH
nr:zinc-dependent peptidase [Deltaproteobacteria bacterium]